MSLFCLCTSIAVFIDYILTFTLLAPIIILVTPKYDTKIAEFEINQENINFLKKPIVNTTLKDEKISQWILKYVKFLNGKMGRSFAFILLILVYVIATLGLFRMKCTFEPSKAFPSDSPLATSLEGIRLKF